MDENARATVSATAAAPVYHSKLRAKREERLQQQLQQHSNVVPNQNAPATETTGTNSILSSAPLVPLLTTRTTARSTGTEEAKRRVRAEARRLLIEYSGTVWDVVRTNDMAMLRNFFLVEGATKLVQAHSKSVDEFGRTLLHTAAWWGRVEVAQFLISNGATLNEIDTVSTRLTPLMDAARAGNTEIGLLLVQHGADLTLRDASGDNAFHWAARHDRGTFLLRISLQLDAIDRRALVDVWTTKNVRGRTPADYIRTHATIFPMISKRLGDHVPLHPVPSTGLTRRQRHSASADISSTETETSSPSADANVNANASSRPTTATTETAPLSGINDLGLDVGSFVYKSRDSIASH